jgi:hypothetical protein
MIVCKRCGNATLGETWPEVEEYLEECELCKGRSSLYVLWLKLRLCLANWRWNLAHRGS